MDLTKVFEDEVKVWETEILHHDLVISEFLNIISEGFTSCDQNINYKNVLIDLINEIKNVTTAKITDVDTSKLFPTNEEYYLYIAGTNHIYYIINETDDKYEFLCYKKLKNIYYGEHDYLMFDHHKSDFPHIVYDYSEAETSGKFITKKNILSHAIRIPKFNLETAGIKYNSYGLTSDVNIITAADFEHVRESFRHSLRR